MENVAYMEDEAVNRQPDNKQNAAYYKEGQFHDMLAHDMTKDKQKRNSASYRVSSDQGSGSSSDLEDCSSSSDTGSCHLQVEKGITFSWNDISVSTKEQTSRGCPPCKTSTTPSKKILKNVSGIVRPGELLALMGASGAGKTTLLNTLLFRNLGDLMVTGKRMANNEIVSPTSLTALSGYVQQEDIFIGTLTVKEHLLFQARVRMDKHIPMKERRVRVKEVMRMLGLTKTKNTVIGIAGRIKGISGGEAKRLAIASEVLTNPPLLFLDEPTSGLDSFMAANVMDILGDLARQGRTIICTIHQPSSQIFSKIQRLLLLAEGEVAFMGSNKHAKEYFARIGFMCPEDYNPSDFFIETLAIQPGIEEECKEKVKMICNEYKASDECKEIASLVKKEEASLHSGRQDTEKRSPYKANWFSQLSALFWRGWLALNRDPMLIHVRIGQSMVLGIILGLIYLQLEMDQIGIGNMNGAMFMLLANVSFGNVFSVVNSLCGELPVMLREHFNGMYSVSSYFLTKQLVDVPITVLSTTVFYTIFYFMIGLHADAAKFFLSLFVLQLVAQVVISLSYFLSAVSPNVDVGLAIAPVVIIPFMIFGGFFLNSLSVPDWLIWMKYLSWFYYGFECMTVIQWSDLTDIPCAFDLGGEMPAVANFTSVLFNSTDAGMWSSNLTMAVGDAEPEACTITGTQLLDRMGFYEEYIGRDIGILFALLFFWRILAYFCLLNTTRRK